METRAGTRVYDVARATGAGRARIIARAALVIRRGGLVAFPTETVYGLGADGLNPAAVNRVFAAKGRPRDNPLILHVDGPGGVEPLVSVLDDRSRDLMDRFWPGPLTLVLPASKRVPLVVRAGLPTVAVRCPDHPVALDLIRAARAPLAAPSANLSGRPSPTSAAHVIDDLAGKVAAVLDAGATGIGVESTVVDMSSATPRILRPGGLAREELEAVLGPVQVARIGPGEPVPSPGLRHRHYAPRASLYVVQGDPGLQAQAVAALGQELRSRGLRVGFVVCEETASVLEADAVEVLGPRGSDRIGARRLFGALRAVDAMGVDAIIAESTHHRGLGLAVSDRLTRAADRVMNACDLAGQAPTSPVLLVCSGNTCRSPMAAAILGRLVPGVDAWSAGTGAAPGQPASPGARAAMASRGLSLCDHRSRPVTADMVRAAGIILTMTGAHRQELEDRFPDARGKTHVLAELAEGPSGGDVSDPFGGDDEVYAEAAARIEELLGRLAERWRGRT